MHTSIDELIRARKSVRTFTNKPLSAKDRQDLETYVAHLTNPMDIPVVFRVLDAKAYKLSSPVIVGADTYLAAKVERLPHFEIAYGYSFEQACLYALSHGLGTVMLAASLSRETFEKAMDVKSSEVMPCASPVGYPAEKRSMREGLMRKGIKADARLPFETLFFYKSFHEPLDTDHVYAHALEMARWAPSAGNGQPWRAVVDGESVHFYEAKSMKDSPLGDIQKVDVGIALSHFDLSLQEAGVHGVLHYEDPGIAVPEKTVYVVSYTRK